MKRNPLWHTDHVRVQSLGHAYRLFCEHCGSEYVWALEPPIPIDVFIAGLNAWGKSHRDCRNRKLDEARAGLLSLLDHRGMQLYAQELDEGMAEFHARQDARNELLDPVSVCHGIVIEQAHDLTAGLANSGVDVTREAAVPR